MQSNTDAGNGSVSTGSKIVLGALTEKTKQIVWGHLSIHEPKTAEALQKASSNEVIRTLLDEHDASLVIDSQLLPLNIKNQLCYAQ